MKRTCTRRRAARSRTPGERLLITNAVTTPRRRASSSAFGGCAGTSARRRGSMSMSRFGAPTSALTSATRPARSSLRRSRATDCRDIPTPGRFRSGFGGSRSGSGEDRTTGSLRPSCGRAASPQLPGDTFLAPGDRRSAVPLTPDRQDPRRVDLRQARRPRPVRSGRDHREARPRIHKHQGHGIPDEGHRPRRPTRATPVPDGSRTTACRVT